MPLITIKKKDEYNYLHCSVISGILDQTTHSIMQKERRCFMIWSPGPMSHVSEENKRWAKKQHVLGPLVKEQILGLTWFLLNTLRRQDSSKSRPLLKWFFWLAQIAYRSTMKIPGMPNGQAIPDLRQMLKRKGLNYFVLAQSIIMTLLSSPFSSMWQ